MSHPDMGRHPIRPLLRVLLCLWCLNLLVVSIAQDTSSSPEVSTSESLESTSTDSTESNETNSPSPAPTVPPGCSSNCSFAYSCSGVQCGTFNLPDNPPAKNQNNQTVLGDSNEGDYVEVTLDARCLMPGERLVLGNDGNMEIPKTVVNCHSNMANDQVLFRAWHGAVFVQYSFDLEIAGEENCTGSASRTLKFNSLNNTSDLEELKNGEIVFPPLGELPPVTGGEWAWSESVTTVASGFGVNITVISVNLNAMKDDYLTINPGLDYDATTAVLFSWKTDPAKPRELRFLERDSFFARLRLGPREDGESMEGLNFRLNFSSFDPVTTTPPPTIAPTPLPTAPSNVSDTLLTYVGGVTAEEFVSRLDEFRVSMADLANEYCGEQNISLMKPVESTNVLVLLVTKCPETWPDAYLCSRVQFAIPVFRPPTENGEPPDYELTENNLQRMWEKLETENTLPDKMTPYETPTRVFWWWIGVTLAVLVIVILLIILAWRIEVHQSISNYRYHSQKNSLMGSSTRGSVSNSGTGIPHQVVPPYLVMEPDLDDSPNTKRTDIFSDQNWGEDNRDSYTYADGGVVNHAYENFEDDEEIDVFRKVDFHSDDEEYVVEAVGPGRRDLIYDTPSLSSGRDDGDLVETRPHIQLRNSVSGHQSETVL